MKRTQNPLLSSSTTNNSKLKRLDDRILSNQNIYSAVVSQQELARKYSLGVSVRTTSQIRQLNQRGRKTLAQKLGMQSVPEPIKWDEVKKLAEERGSFTSHCPICMDRYFPPNIKQKERKVCLLSCGHVFHYNCINNFEKFTTESSKNEHGVVRTVRNGNRSIGDNSRRGDTHSTNRNRHTDTHSHIHSQGRTNSIRQSRNNASNVQRSIFNQYSLMENKPNVTVIHRCPYCRAEDYEKENITSLVHKRMRHWAATEVQRIWRSYVGWKNYRERRFQVYPEERKLHISNRLVTLASKFEKHTMKRTMDIDRFLNDLDKSVQQSRLIMMNNRDWSSIIQDAKDKLRDDEKEGVDCAICMCPIQLGNKSAVVTSCKHLFHQQCLKSFEAFTLNQSDSCACPLCRSPFLKQILE